jgi:hypothetical protein
MSDGWIKTERGWLKRYGPPRQPVNPGQFPTPRVITDTMPPTEHVDGKTYDSKSAFRRVTKENGLIEVGNDPARHRKIQKPKPDSAKTREAVKKAVAKVLG